MICGNARPFLRLFLKLKIGVGANEVVPSSRMAVCLATGCKEREIEMEPVMV